MCTPELQLKLVRAAKIFAEEDVKDPAEEERPRDNHKRGPLFVTHVTGQNSAYDNRYVQIAGP